MDSNPLIKPEAPDVEPGSATAMDDNPEIKAEVVQPQSYRKAALGRLEAAVYANAQAREELETMLEKLNAKLHGDPGMHYIDKSDCMQLLEQILYLAGRINEPREGDDAKTLEVSSAAPMDIVSIRDAFTKEGMDSIKPSAGFREIIENLSTGRDVIRYYVIFDSPDHASFVADRHPNFRRHKFSLFFPKLDRATRSTIRSVQAVLSA